MKTMLKGSPKQCAFCGGTPNKPDSQHKYLLTCKCGAVALSELGKTIWFRNLSEASPVLGTPTIKHQWTIGNLIEVKRLLFG